VRPEEGVAFVRASTSGACSSPATTCSSAWAPSPAARPRASCFSVDDGAAQRARARRAHQPPRHRVHRQALTAALAASTAPLLFVSHDRWFVSAARHAHPRAHPDGPREFPGTYDEYLARSGDDHLDAEAVVLKAKKERQKDAATDGAKADGAGAVGSSWEDQKRRRNRLKELPQRRDKVLETIEAAEARKKAIHDAYAEDGFFIARRSQLNRAGDPPKMPACCALEACGRGRSRRRS
jgi:hypothetical protein